VSTPAAPTGPRRRSRVRFALVVVLLAVLVGWVTVAVSGGPTAPLDPDSWHPDGSRALAVLLRARGVRVERVETVAAAVAAAPGSTVLLSSSYLLPTAELDQLLGVRAADLVLVDPDPRAATSFGVLPSSSFAPPGGPLDPGCPLPAALLAGNADIAGTGYDTRDPGTVGCYPDHGRPTLVSVDGGRVVVVGSAVPFTNARLAHDGDAALALGLLSQRPTLVWLVPQELVAAPAAGAQRSFTALLPVRLKAAVLQLFVAVLLLALWRARRLGRVVVEPLPVVVRAAEAVEGRGRLYQAAGARDTAAEALRASLRATLGSVLGLGDEPTPAALADAVAARTGRPGAEVGALLYGAPPDDDRGLVGLADALDTLDREVRHP